MPQPNPGCPVNWEQRALWVQKEAHVFYLVFKHPRTRWYTRLVAACTAAYLFSPIQLIPSFIPVIGFLDDLLVLFVGVKLLQRITPADVLTECRGLADKAAINTNEERRWAPTRVLAAAIVAMGLLAAITASALIAAYISH